MLVARIKKWWEVGRYHMRKAGCDVHDLATGLGRMVVIYTYKCMSIKLCDWRKEEVK